MGMEENAIVRDSEDKTTEVINWKNTPVTVISFGGHPPSKIVSSKPPRLILIGTGIPGIPALYATYARHLHRKTELPTWILGFTGIDSKEPISGYEMEFSLKGQILMKKDIIQKYLTGVEVICVDHSTSCYISLRLLEDPKCSLAISHLYFTMPVFGSVDTKLGKMLKKMTNSELSEGFFGAMFNFVPFTIKKMIAKLLFRSSEDEAHWVDLVSSLTSETLHNSFQVARELMNVFQFPATELRKNSSRIHYIFSPSDNLLSSEDLSFLNDQDKRLCPIPHQFLCQHSEALADEVYAFILDVEKRQVGNQFQIKRGGGRLYVIETESS